MRRLFTFALCAAGFILIAAPIYMEKDVHQVLINGKPFGNAQFVNGQWVIAIEDFSKATGGSLTLEPYFKLNGNHLSVLVPSYSADDKHGSAFQKPDGSATANTIGGVQKPDASAGANTIGGVQLKQNVNGGLPTDQGKFHNNAIIAIRKAGEISSHVFNANGKAWVPLADVAKALGGTFTAPANLQPGQSFTLNFAPNPASILGYQTGGHGH